jgi:hypothetical protein
MRAARMLAMEVLAARRPTRPSLLPQLLGAAVGAVLITLGIVIAWVAYATPFLEGIVPDGRATTGQMVFGMATWSVALIAPAGFLLVGGARLAAVLAKVRLRHGMLVDRPRWATGLPAGSLVATDIDIGDGRPVSGLVVGPFGAAVIREAPPPAVTRRNGGYWEIRTPDRWLPIEDPLGRASRDADRVRRWFAHDGQDFVVKVHAAVISVDRSIPRTATCAVIRPDEVGAWLASLPPQRSLTTGRLDRLHAVVRAAI